MNKLLKKYTLLLVSIFLLFACKSSIESKDSFISKDDPNWLQHLQQLKKFQQYNVNGQLGYISTNKRFSANFTLQQQNLNNYVLKITSNLVNKSLTVTVSPQKSTIQDEKGKIVRSNSRDINQSIKQNFGVDIPLTQIITLLKGYIEPNYNDYNVSKDAVLHSFKYNFNQTNWDVNYQKYMLVNDLKLPQDIQVINPQQKIKIHIHEWK